LIPRSGENAYRRIFALVLGQKNQLWWDLPAIESFSLLKAIYGLQADDYKRTLDELVELLGIADKLNVMVRELSLGERMKMELIAALIHRPKVLFLDEPTIGLDVVSQRAVRLFLRDYNRRHRVTIILTSHYMADIKELCERVIVIHKGQQDLRRRPGQAGNPLRQQEEDRAVRAQGRGVSRALALEVRRDDPRGGRDVHAEGLKRRRGRGRPGGPGDGPGGRHHGSRTSLLRTSSRSCSSPSSSGAAHSHFGEPSSNFRHDSRGSIRSWTKPPAEEL